MSGPKKQANKRRTLRIRRDKVIEMAKCISVFGMEPQGFAEAIKFIKSAFYWSKGNEQIDLTDQEAAKLIQK